jgi:hypothetical protein
MSNDSYSYSSFQELMLWSIRLDSKGWLMKVQYLEVQVMNTNTCHENSGDVQGCHAGMQKLTRQHSSIDVRRVGLGLGFSLLSFIVFLFFYSKVLPGMNSAARQAILGLLALVTTLFVMVGIKKFSKVLLNSHKTH